MKITRENAEKLIKSTNGAIFSVEFTKKNGDLREMSCRLGVKKGVKGVGLKFAPADYEILPVYDMTQGGYRMISLDTLKRVTVDGKTYQVIQ